MRTALHRPGGPLPPGARMKTANWWKATPFPPRCATIPGTIVTVNLAAEYPLTKKWVALVELTSTWDGGRLIGHQANLAPTALLSVLPGIEYMATDKFSLALGVKIDLAGKNTSANHHPLAFHGLMLFSRFSQEEPRTGLWERPPGSESGSTDFLSFWSGPRDDPVT